MPYAHHCAHSSAILNGLSTVIIEFCFLIPHLADAFSLHVATMLPKAGINFPNEAYSPRDDCGVWKLYGKVLEDIIVIIADRFTRSRAKA